LHTVTHLKLTKTQEVGTSFPFYGYENRYRGGEDLRKVSQILKGWGVAELQTKAASAHGQSAYSVPPTQNQVSLLSHTHSPGSYMVIPSLYLLIIL